jgi:hypothetical protein
MESENLDIESITEARREKIASSIKEISLAELNAIWEGLFPGANDPWRERFRRFIDENAGGRYHYASSDGEHPNDHWVSRLLEEYASSTYFLATRDHFQVVYCRTKERGIWFIPDTGLGLLDTRILKVMKEIVDTSR